MTFTENLSWLAVGNPVSKAVIGTTKAVFTSGIGHRSSVASTKALTSGMPALWKLSGRHHNVMRLAGLCGASAVILGAIGSHKLKSSNDNSGKDDLKVIFDTANRFHFFHSLALLSVPLARYPYVTASLLLFGTSLFSGVLYYRAFADQKTYTHLAPIGGTCLILAWLSFLL